MANFEEYNEALVPKRPQFLTILCILTFIGSFYAVCSGIFSYTNADKMEAKTREAKVRTENRERNNGPNNSGKEVNRKVVMELQTLITAPKIRESSAGNIISALICILGAILMWKLKKVGYFIYIFGIAVGIATSLFVYGTGSFLAVGITIFGAFTGALFIVLYGLNLKSLK